MSALLISLSLFGFAWLMHLLWWRWRIPFNHTRTLLVVFCLAPAFAVIIWLICGAPRWFHLWDIFSISLLYLGAVGCYLIAYTAIEETSPSLAIFSALQASGSNGCSSQELSKVITDTNFIKPRLDALRRDGILVAASGGYVLSSSGKKAVGLAKFISSIFKVEKNA